MKNISKHLISLAILAFLVVPVLTLTANAQFDPGLNQVSNGLNNSLSNTDPRTVIGRIINMALGFLGVIAVGIILLGGFKWMTAGGNEEKTGEAKKLLGAGVIGLVIILSSWAIATFVINSLNTAVN
ncbi:MAG: pilin [Candidatus Falkowbacteria bacterium]|nr:pilin [Candidatus Falkowbacteria bacterium]